MLRAERLFCHESCVRELSKPAAPHHGPLKPNSVRLKQNSSAAVPDPVKQHTPLAMAAPSLTAKLLSEFVGTFLLVLTVGCNVLGGNGTWVACQSPLSS